MNPEKLSEIEGLHRENIRLKKDNESLRQLTDSQAQRVVELLKENGKLRSELHRCIEAAKKKD